MKGLEALEIIKTFQSIDEKRVLKEYNSIIEKELKALEIVARVMELNVNWSKQLLGMGYLTQEEHDLLKEVLL